MENLRKCCVCKQFKSYDNFHKNCRKYLGLSNTCKLCNKLKNKDYQKTIKYKNKRIVYYMTYRNSHKEYEMWRHAKKRAKLDNREFTITIEDIVIPEFCPVLSIPLNRESNGKSDNSPSLDRIDNTKGYIKGNICVISWRANNIKNIGSALEHRKIAEYIERNVK